VKRISEIPVSERPREKLIARGASALSDMELLAIILGSGTKGKSVLSLAKEVLMAVDGKNGALLVEDLRVVDGIGTAKACLLTAAVEFARRRIHPEGTKIRGPEDVLPLIQHLADRPQEHVVCISLNGAHEVIAVRIVTVGLVNASQIHPREVFSDPLKDRACSIIVAHNHPSGELEPSPEDLAATRTIYDAGKTLGINLLDHLIFSKRGYVSLKERGTFCYPASLRPGE
jgi:DNA repair protein RadC